VECPTCGAAVDPTVAKNLRSVRALLRLVNRDEELPPRLREDLATRLETDLEDLLAVAMRVRMPEQESPAPAPEPTPEPPVATGELPPRPLEDPSPKRTGPPVSRTKPRKPPREGPGVWERLGPAFTENILFALAAFLMVAGAVFFVTTAWTTMTGQEKLLVILGGLELMGFLLYGAGRLLNRGGTLPEVERVLLVVVAFLVPVAAAAAGEILRSSTALGLAAAAAVLVPGWFAIRSVARRTEPALHPLLPAAMTALSLLTLAGTAAGSSPVSAAAVLAAVVIGIGFFAARDVVPHVGRNVNPVLWSSLLIAFGTLVAAGTFALAAARDGTGAAHPLAGLGVALSSIAMFGALLEGALTGNDKLTKARALPFLVGSLALAVAGAAIAAGNESALLVASVVGAAAAIHAGSRLPSAWLLLPGLALSAIAYIYLPAPVRSAAIALRDRVAEGLGYGASRLPLSYYAVSLVPYVAVSGAMGIWLRRRGAVRHGRVLAAWSLAVAVGLCLMSVVLGSDLRAPAAAFAAQGALLLVLSRFARSPGYVYVGAAGLLVSLAFLLGHLDVAQGVRALAFGAAGLLGLAIVRRLDRCDSEDGFAAEAGSAVFRVVLITTVFVGAVLSGGVLVRWAGWMCGLSPIPAGGWLPAAGYVVFLLLVLDLGRTARTAIVLPAAAVLVAGAVECLMEGVGLSAAGAWRPVFFTAVAGLHLLLPRPSIPGRGRAGGVAVTVAIIAHSVFGVFPRIEAWTLVGWDGPGALSLIAIAALLIVAGQWLRQTWSGALAAPVLAVAAMGIASALGYDQTAIPGAIAVSASSLVLGALCFPLRRFVTPWRIAIALVALILTVWQFPLAGPGRYGVPVAALFAVLAARLAMSVDRREPFRSLVGAAGGIVLAWIPFGLLVAAHAEWHFVGIGLVASGAVAMFWAGRDAAARAVAAGHLFMALLIAGFSCAVLTEGAGWHCVTMLLVTAGGRFLINRFARVGTVLFLLGLASFVSVGLAEGIFDLGIEWQPAILASIASIALLAPRVEVLGLHRRAATGIAALPLTALTGVAVFGAVGVASGAGLSGVYHGAGGPALVAGAVLYSLGAWLLSRGVRHAGRDAIWIVAVALAVFAFAPVNQLIGGDHPRPDIEIALLAVLVAARLPVRARADRPAHVAPAAVNGVYLVAAGALLLTAVEWHHLSTPLTLIALILPPVVLLRRRAGTVHATVAGFVLLGAALSMTAYAFPESHTPGADLLIAFSVACAVVLLGLRRLGEWARTHAGGAVPEGTGRSLIPPAAAAHLLSVAFLAANVVVARGSGPASGVAIAAAVLSMGIGGTVSMRIATTRDRPRALHGTVVSLLLLYAFTAVRTGALGMLDGYHLHALIVVGTGVFFAAPRVPPAFGNLLRVDGLLLALPAVLVALHDLLGSETPPGSAATALFLAAAFAGVAAARLKNAPLGAASVVLLNLAVFALWRRHGIVDPAFYGVPPGLTLLLGAELSRKHLARGGRLALFLPGAALLYGSIGVQVLSVERPAHALVLFALGIVTVGFGVFLRRNSLLAAGTAVVVLDVVAYLAMHGFQRGFLGAALLLMAGLTVLGVGTLTAKRRKRAGVSDT